ncbi:549_t:CDS:2 [Ambispora gerdemannii]|uniref:549_t:CDS:1 n=1 Tax=Ambispora gerdemannii TaxID=144530 RepID=A0A9N9GEA5_9GLOM|nr:549_t:CDS:2 [Ambispora gerdemannii]
MNSRTTRAKPQPITTETATKAQRETLTDSIQQICTTSKTVQVGKTCQTQQRRAGNDGTYLAGDYLAETTFAKTKLETQNVGRNNRPTLPYCAKVGMAKNIPIHVPGLS